MVRFIGILVIQPWLKYSQEVSFAGITGQLQERTMNYRLSHDLGLLLRQCRKNFHL